MVYRKNARTATLGWLKNLPENGADVRGAAASEEHKLHQRAELVRQIEALDKELETLRQNAEEKARKNWTRREIADAKRWHAEDVAAGRSWA